MYSASIGISTQWSSQFPTLAESDDRHIDHLFSHAKKMSFPDRATVTTAGATSEHYVLVTKGCIRVQMLTDKGRAVILYRVRPGEGCILTTASLLGSEPFPAESIAESATEVLAMSGADFERTIENSALFRRFVFSSVGQRLTDVFARIEQLCSPSIDRHLAGVLLDMGAADNSPVAVTHQALALELGTAREVVSRHLKQFEANGWVQLGRGTIQVREPGALKQLLRK